MINKKPNNLKELVAIYIRVSTDEQAEHGVSLSAQKVRLTAFCQAHGWDIYDVYMDDGYSGKDLNRPAMQRMIREAEEGQFKHVLVLKLDRLSRRQKDTLFLIEDVFLKAEIGFHSVTESFDTTTPYGKAALGMMAVFAQLERETIVERVKMAKKETSRQGKWKGGETPYGYRYNMLKKQLEINPEEAVHTKEIFDLYTSGKYGFQTIADILNEKKIRTRKNVLWLKSTVRLILLNPTYTGKIRHYKDTYESTHEPIISDEQFELAQQMLSNRYVARPDRDEDNLLGGIIYCSECGAMCRFKSRRLKVGRGKYYVCYTRYGTMDMAKADHCDSPYHPAKKINNAVVEKISTYAFNEKLIDEQIKKLLCTDDEKTIELERLKADKQSIVKRLDRWYDAFENGMLDSAQLVERVKTLRERQMDLEEKINAIEQSIELEKRLVFTSEEIKLALKDFKANWEYADPTERRAIIANLVDKVIVYPSGGVDVKLKL